MHPIARNHHVYSMCHWYDEFNDSMYYVCYRDIIVHHSLVYMSLLWSNLAMCHNDALWKAIVTKILPKLVLGNHGESSMRYSSFFLFKKFDKFKFILFLFKKFSKFIFSLFKKFDVFKIRNKGPFNFNFESWPKLFPISAGIYVFLNPIVPVGLSIFHDPCVCDFAKNHPRQSSALMNWDLPARWISGVCSHQGLQMECSLHTEE